MHSPAQVVDDDGRAVAGVGGADAGDGLVFLAGDGVVVPGDDEIHGGLLFCF